MIRIRLIENWQVWWRLWSIRLGAIGAALMAYLTASPDAAITAWAMLPSEFKDVLPPDYLKYIGLSMFVLSLFARVVKQEKLPEVNKDEQK